MQITKQWNPQIVIVQSSVPVTLIGGAKVTPQDVNAAITHAPVLVAADSGADHLMGLGHEVAAVIGDMDSLSADARAAFADRLHPIAEQDSTDFDKALRHIEAPLVLALGVSGGRFDHELAAMHVLLAHPGRPCVVIGAESIVCLCPPRLEMAVAPGTLVSLFPFAPVGAVSRGLRWPLEGIAFAPESRIGTSNEALGPVQLEADAPSMMLILPRDQLSVLVTALMSVPADARWPARAR